MKKPWIIGITVALVVIVAVAGVLILTQDQTAPKKQNASVADHCWEHVTDQKVVELADGTVEVTLTAPDYVTLAKLLAAEEKNELTGSAIIQLVENNPEVVKEYQFTASSSGTADIKAALKEQIAYELIAQMLTDVSG